MRLRLPHFGIVLATLTLGCGGAGQGMGGGGNTGGNGNVSPQTRVAAFDIDWGAQGQEFTAPASAQSAVISIINQDPTGPGTTATVNRASPSAVYDQVYNITTTQGPYVVDVDVTFYSQPNGKGAYVGSAGTGGVSIGSQGALISNVEGKPLGPLVTIGPLASLAIVNEGLTVPIGSVSYLYYNGYDANGNSVWTPAGGGTWVAQSNAYFTISATGALAAKAVGSTQVTVSYGGITSPPVTVTVTGP